MALTVNVGRQILQLLHPSNFSTVANGEHTGDTLSTLIHSYQLGQGVATLNSIIRFTPRLEYNDSVVLAGTCTFTLELTDSADGNAVNMYSEVISVANDLTTEDKNTFVDVHIMDSATVFECSGGKTTAVVKDSATKNHSADDLKFNLYFQLSNGAYKLALRSLLIELID